MDRNKAFDASGFRNRLPRFTPEARKANQAITDLLDTIAQKKQATFAQKALSHFLFQMQPSMEYA